MRKAIRGIKLPTFTSKIVTEPIADWIGGMSTDMTVWRKIRRAVAPRLWPMTNSKKAFEIVAKSPRSVKTACQQIEKELRKSVSPDTFKRVLKSAGHTWKRVRRNLKPMGLEHPISSSPPLNVLGFLNLRGDFQLYVIAGSVNSEFVIHCFDTYCAQFETLPDRQR